MNSATPPAGVGAFGSAPISGREQGLCNGISPWLAPLAMVLTQDLVMPAWFGRITVLGAEQLPRGGAVLLAPTHRSRWDALLLPRVAGRRVSGRDCRFMVTIDEMRGLQGWFLHRLGCFPVDQGRPTLASLRYALDLLACNQQLVVFPEGKIRQQDEPIQLQQGLARLALLARGQGVDVTVVPVGIAYSHPQPRLRDEAALCFGTPLQPAGQGRDGARRFNAELAVAMQSAEQAARSVLGRPILCP
ncbi:MAG: lysophospholipid acyltransferase family protein [Synechococcaceae cyanobacterium]|nr:lysophospholipid acyltransferase family protein [Synechococcaceae cyanobacterium]